MRVSAEATLPTPCHYAGQAYGPWWDEIYCRRVTTYQAPATDRQSVSPTSAKSKNRRPTIDERIRAAVGCELEFKPLLAADTNHGSAFPNDNRPGERSYGQ